MHAEPHLALTSDAATDPSATAEPHEAPEPPVATVYHGQETPDAVLRLAREVTGATPVPIRSLDALPTELIGPTLVLLTRELVPEPPSDLSSLPKGAMLVVADPSLAGPTHETAYDCSNRDHPAATRELRLAAHHAQAAFGAQSATRDLVQAREDLNRLSRIGMALMTQRDPDALLSQLLAQARQITASDAGSLYLIERSGTGSEQLRFKLVQNDSRPDFRAEETTLPVDRTSLAGYVALTGEVLVIDDVHQLSSSAPYRFDRRFDERTGYETRSMLVVPILDHYEQRVGVLQLINCKEDPSRSVQSADGPSTSVIPYRRRHVEVARCLAGQAGVTIENTDLYTRISRMFDGFVMAAVSAIDSRDPSTAGHSTRVAAMTTALADAAADVQEGPYADFSLSPQEWRELWYATLLHDLGKIGVREEVLVKGNKLPDVMTQRVHDRFDLIRRSMEAEHQRARAELWKGTAPATAEEQEPKLEREYAERTEELERFYNAFRTANEPTPLTAETVADLDAMARRSFTTSSGENGPYLTAEELRLLKISRGTLDENERAEIESHVDHSYEFLRRLPWSDDLRRVPEIAYAHHERLDGSGYPRGVAADVIPVQARIMMICDVFDALTAADRPYRPAKTAEQGIAILREEVEAGRMDEALVELFVSQGIYKLAMADRRA